MKMMIYPIGINLKQQNWKLMWKHLDHILSILFVFKLCLIEGPESFQMYFHAFLMCFVSFCEQIEILKISSNMEYFEVLSYKNLPETKQRRFSDETIHLEIVASNILDFEAEPNQNVEIRCKGTGKPQPELFYQFANETEQNFVEVETNDMDLFEAKAPEINSRRNVTVTCRASNKYENVTISKVIIIKSK